jgi:lipoprotein-anchoring transpeptidase ErfK/SrfK
VSFVQGEQHVTVLRAGDGVEAAIGGLMSGPSPAERAREVRTYILPGTPVRSITQEGTVAVIDVGSRFVAPASADDTLARLSQLVQTATDVPGVRSVRVLVEGGVPLGLFPGVDTSRPVTQRDLATPDVSPPRPSVAPEGPPAAGVRADQQRLADLGYLDPAGVDGTAGPATEAAIIAFQKWEGLDRDGEIGPRTRARLARAQRPTPITRGSGRRVEVLIDRQLVLAIDGSRVVRAIHTSTGKPSTPTPIGNFRVYAQYPRWWSVPFREWLLWASPFVGGVAFHQFPEVPVEAASHGCVRITESNARWLYGFVKTGMSVRVIEESR